MKQRYSSLDVKVIAHELNARLTSLRISNIYDLSSRIFLIKFSKPDHKEQFVIDSGFRAHLTSFVRTTAAAPSPFVQKLRKTLKTRRVTEVKQVGTDRILQFTFSDGLFYLFLEFYAGGNIVLTDGELNVIALLRMVNEGEEHERLRVGLKYNLSMRQNYEGVPDLTLERVKAGLQKAVDRTQVPEAGAKKGKKAGKDALRKSLAVSINEVPPMLIDHAMRVKDFDSGLLPKDVLESEEMLEKLLEVLREAKQVVEEITKTDVVKGYILAKPGAKKLEIAEETNATSKETDEGESKKKGSSGLIYDDFHPFKPRQFEDDPNITFLEFDGFNKTVDEFFSSIEGQKLESKLHEREEAARKKLESARQDHKKRLGGLQEVQELNIRKAEAILANVARVEEAQAAMNGLIAQGMDWVDIGRLIEAEQSRDNEVAKLIKLPLKLHENTITLLLGEAEEQDDEDSADDSASESESEEEDSEEDHSTSKRQAKKPAADTRLSIDIDLSLTPWANASQYYDQKKNAAVKEEKTLQASTKALKSAEQKITLDLKKGLKVEKDVLRPVRKAFWFEKFHYFISSDGYLVLGGKDAQQNEMLYRRYLKKGDVYVHADLNGASSVIIKNNPSTPDAPIPPSTLSQAGTLSVASSNAWDSKAVMSAYWVNADQVSKTAPTGEYLTTGGFMIRGKKNFLPPAPLLLGFALVFNISEESKARHQKHRFQSPAKLASDTATVTSAVETVADPGDDEDDDSDEDFPDAQLDAGTADSDDEDFPDAKLDGTNGESEAETAVGTQPDSDSESDEDESKPSQNPLQSATVVNEQKTDPGVGNRPESSLSQSDTLDEQSVADEEKEDKSGRRHLPAKHRQLLKKGINPASIAAMTEQGDLDSQYSSQDDDTTTIGGSKHKSHPLPRGKRGKQKKALAKYADQDEEERALAMRILGSKSGQDAAAAEAEARRAKEEQAAKDKERRRQQHLKTQTEGKAAEEARRAAQEAEEDDDNDETTRASLLGLDAFVGRPLPGDELLSAIPICAPWSALGTYKYKAKLQPGAVKKGKAVNEILSKWQLATKNAKALDKTSTDVEKIWPREIGLIEGLKAVESVGVIPVTKVRVLMAGGADGKGGGAQGGKGKGNGKTAKRGGRGSKKK